MGENVQINQWICLASMSQAPPLSPQVSTLFGHRTPPWIGTLQPEFGSEKLEENRKLPKISGIRSGSQRVLEKWPFLACPEFFMGQTSCKAQELGCPRFVWSRCSAQTLSGICWLAGGKLRARQSEAGPAPHRKDLSCQAVLFSATKTENSESWYLDLTSWLNHD